MKTNILICIMVALLISCGGSDPATEVPISFAWSYRADDYVRGVPTVSDTVVYVGADDNTLHAVNADTGEFLWRYETADNITSSPVVFRDAIYFGTWDGAV
jgi:outer membrane protein assembly factor BamB